MDKFIFRDLAGRTGLSKEGQQALQTIISNGFNSILGQGKTDKLNIINLKEFNINAIDQIK